MNALLIKTKNNEIRLEMNEAGFFALGVLTGLATGVIMCLR